MASMVVGAPYQPDSSAATASAPSHSNRQCGTVASSRAPSVHVSVLMPRPAPISAMRRSTGCVLVMAAPSYAGLAATLQPHSLPVRHRPNVPFLPEPSTGWVSHDLRTAPEPTSRRWLLAATAALTGLVAGSAAGATFYDNGGQANGPGQDPDGPGISILDTAGGDNLFGFGASAATGFRVADDFAVTGPEGGTSTDSSSSPTRPARPRRPRSPP